MGHVVLLGRSVFDNGAYVARGEPDVVRRLRGCLPAGWRATLAVVDGAVTGGVPRQLGGLPPDATHLVVSAGGGVEGADYANPIEPSARGGAKIARAIAGPLGEHDPARRRSEVFAWG